MSVRAFSAIRAVTLLGESLTQDDLEVSVDVRSRTQLMLTMCIGTVNVRALSMLGVKATKHCFGEVTLKHVVFLDGRVLFRG